MIKDTDNFVRRQDMKRQQQESVGSESEDVAEKKATVRPTAEVQQAAKDQLMYEKSTEKLKCAERENLNNILQTQVDQLKEDNTVIRKKFDDLKVSVHETRRVKR